MATWNTIKCWARAQKWIVFWVGAVAALVVSAFLGPAVGDWTGGGTGMAVLVGAILGFAYVRIALPIVDR